MRITNRPFHLVHHADAAAGEKYQEYATRLLKLDALQRTSPDAEEPIDVSALTPRESAIKVESNADSSVIVLPVPVATCQGHFIHST